MSTLDVDRLEALGFFRHVRVADLPRVLDEVRSTNYPFVDEAHRLYRADAERLAEHGVRDFLGSVAPFLRREGVAIDVEYRRVKTGATRTGRPARWAVAELNAEGWFDEDEPSSFVESMRISLEPGSAPCEVTEDELEESETYLLFFGDREYAIFTSESGDPCTDETASWRIAAVATVKLLNELLSAHGSPERAYAVSDGNDLEIAFVTPQMATLINTAVDPRARLHDGSGAASG